MSIPPQEPNVETKLKEELDGGGPLSGFRQWLVDSYNGLYVIVLKPSMPEGMLYGMGILGLLFGLFWAYMVQPAQFAGGNPNRLNAESQQQWLQLVAVSASLRNYYAPEDVIDLVKTIPNPRATIDGLLASGTLSQSDQQAMLELYNMLPADIDSHPDTARAISGANFVWDLITGFLIPLIVMLIIIVAGVLLWRILIYGNLVAPVLARVREMRDPVYAEQRRKEQASLDDQRKARAAVLAMKQDTAASSGGDLGAPVMQQLAIFRAERKFDESFEIELESGEFLGQSGANVSEDVAPDPVAIDVWLFDIFDSMTLVKTFITPAGNADPNIRSRVLSTLDSPNDLIVANPGATITIDSPKLRLQANFNTLDFNEQGRFSNFNMVMRAWQKDAAGAKVAPPMPSMPAPVIPAPMPTGAPPMSTYDDIQFDPPPPPASGGRPMSDYDDISFDPPPAPPPASGGRPMSDYDDISFDPPPAMPQRPAVQPLQPPPLRPQAPQPLQPPPLRRPEDDDPFGGTGDFTPLNG
jgi:type II secretory pathway component PulM